MTRAKKKKQESQKKESYANERKIGPAYILRLHPRIRSHLAFATRTDRQAVALKALSRTMKGIIRKKEPKKSATQIREK